MVEDSPVYRSFFLPLIYKVVVRQTLSVIEDTLNEEHRLLKMRARPGASAWGGLSPRPVVTPYNRDQ